MNRAVDYGALDNLFHGRKGNCASVSANQLRALGLVVNATVLRNTRDMGVVLDELRSTGHPVLEADVARLTPLLHDHIHMLGKYDFTLPEAVAQASSDRCGIRPRWRTTLIRFLSAGFGSESQVTPTPLGE